MQKVIIMNSRLLAIPCETSAKLTNVEFVDISGNLLMDLSPSRMMCDSYSGFQSPHTISVSRCYLHSVNSKLFSKLKQLQHRSEQKQAAENARVL